MTPKLIISTHPIATAAIDYLKRLGRLKAPFWVAISDWHIQPFWLFPNVDCYLVPTHLQKLEVEQIAIPRSKIIVTGMLLRETYYRPIDQKEARAQLKLPSSAGLIVVMGGGCGWGLKRILKGLTKLEARLIVIAGSAERQVQIQSYLQRHTYYQHVEVLGFVDPLPYLAAADLVVTKPGGLSTAEALHLRKPLILVEPVPGQEEENLRILRKHGICSATSSNELERFAKKILESRNVGGSKPLGLDSIASDTTPQVVLENICGVLKRKPPSDCANILSNIP
jgi:processive 1,2-diacylglycerol beta-glucosyltransferase